MRSQAIKKVNGPNHCDVASTTTVTSKQITGRWFALQRYVKSANLLNCVPTYMTFLLRLFYQYQFYLTESKTALCELQPVEAAPAHCWAISLINLFFFSIFYHDLTQTQYHRNVQLEKFNCWVCFLLIHFVFLVFCFSLIHILLFYFLIDFFFLLSLFCFPLCD